MVSQKLQQIKECEDRITTYTNLLNQMNRQMNKIDYANTESEILEVISEVTEVIKSIGTNPKEVEKILDKADDQQADIDYIMDMLGQPSEFVGDLERELLALDDELLATDDELQALDNELLAMDDEFNSEQAQMITGELPSPPVSNPVAPVSTVSNTVAPISRPPVSTVEEVR